MLLFNILKRNFDYTLPESEEYDNIIPCGYNTFIVYKSGKIGLCKTENDKKKIVCDAEYDLIDCIGNNLFLSNESDIYHYNLFFGTLNKYTELEIELPYIYACDKEYQYIIHQESNETVYKRRYTEYNKSWFKFCGETEKGPVFFDYHHCVSLYPSDEKYKPNDKPLEHPLIINQENILNIIWDENGLGVADSFGNSIIDNAYDEIAVELCVTGKNKNGVIKKNIKLPNSVFNKETMSDISKW